MDSLLTGDNSYGRAGLIGYANGATIKNVVVCNAKLSARWQIAAVCGRIDNGKIENCGSFGNLRYNFVTASSAQNARVGAGVVTTDSPNSVKSVWSTYSSLRTEAPVRNDFIPSQNYVVGVWNSADKNQKYVENTRNADDSYDPDMKWVYVPKDNVAEWLRNGTLCYQVNGDPNNGIMWTQTFVAADNSVDTCKYNLCPRPTTRGLAVYQDGTTYSNHIYTISFDSNGGSECADVFVTRRYAATSRTYPSPLPTPTLDGSSFVGWFTELNGETQFTEASETTVKSDITLYAKWLGGPQTITVNANQDPQNAERYYCTFYYGEQAYQKPEDVVAYIATRSSDSNDLIMRSLKDGNGNVSRIIPAGEAVILKAKSNTITLTAVDSEAEVNENNLLYGSDEDVSVMDVSDYIPSSDESESAADVVYNNCFIFSGEQGTLGFYPPKSETLAAHKAYILLDGVIITDFSNDPEQQAKSLKMIFEDEESEATGISENFVAVKADKTIYNINGVRLSKLQKGLNIVGGKKIFVK